MSKVVMVRGAGGPEVLHIEERALPEPGPGEVRIAVEACGVAFGDVMRRKGVLAPLGAFTPGYDIVGRVEALGPGATAEVGGRVAVFMPSTGLGGYAEHVVVSAQLLAPVPDGVEPGRAVAVGLNYITAWQLLTRFAAVPQGGAVLCHGVAGGVGTAVLDVARVLGITVYGTASAGKHEQVRALGGIPIDYRSEDFVERIAHLTEDGVHTVIDGIGGAHLRRSYQCLRPGGTLVALGVSGAVDGGLLAVAAAQWHYLVLKLWPDGKAVKQYMISVSRGAGKAAIRDDWAHLLELLAAGDLDPSVAIELPLSEVREAHRLLDERAVVGKVVLRPDAA